MKKLLIYLVISLIASSQLNAETKSRALVNSSISFKQYSTYLDDITLNLWLKCYNRIGSNAGRKFSKKFTIRDYNLIGSPKVSKSGYVSGQHSFSLPNGRNKIFGKVSFSGNVEGLGGYIQTYTKLTYSTYTCYELHKFNLSDF